MNHQFDERFWSRTDVPCSACDEKLSFTEEVVLIQVIQPVLHEGGVVYHHPVVDEYGDYLYWPHVLHFSCWENIYNEVQEMVENAPPIEDHYSPWKCGCCGSGIRSNEYALSWALGEYHASRRQPQTGDARPRQNLRFEQACDPVLMCLYCANLLNDHSLRLWDEGVTMNEECTDCQLLRCNRYAACGCRCHQRAGDNE